MLLKIIYLHKQKENYSFFFFYLHISNLFFYKLILNVYKQFNKQHIYPQQVIYYKINVVLE